MCIARQLSGGERRRVALALLLGFADLISARGRLQCNLIVLDEVQLFNFAPCEMMCQEVICHQEALLGLRIQQLLVLLCSCPVSRND